MVSGEDPQGTPDLHSPSEIVEQITAFSVEAGVIELLQMLKSTF